MSAVSREVAAKILDAVFSPPPATGPLRIKVTVEREDGTELHFFYPLDRGVRFGDRVVLEFTVGDVSES